LAKRRFKPYFNLIALPLGGEQEGAKRNKFGGKVEVVLLFSDWLIYVNSLLTIADALIHTHLQQFAQNKILAKQRFKPYFNRIALPEGAKRSEVGGRSKFYFYFRSGRFV
jgi:hypothetical protein